MKGALIKLHIKRLEQHLKVLKAKIISRREKRKTLSDYYGFFKGKMDLSLEEIKRIVMVY
ncbi:MAG: hypothetical protein HW390_427 [Candidatus Brocadiaceae bacterium]|nr:hypothetical protein [Candidatus Brocadiaceae bacterium]